MVGGTHSYPWLHVPTEHPVTQHGHPFLLSIPAGYQYISGSNWSKLPSPHPRMVSFTLELQVTRLVLLEIACRQRVAMCRHLADGEPWLRSQTWPQNKEISRELGSLSKLTGVSTFSHRTSSEGQLCLSQSCV